MFVVDLTVLYFALTTKGQPATMLPAGDLTEIWYQSSQLISSS